MGSFLWGSTNLWKVRPRDPRCNILVPNQPTGRSTLGVSEGMLGDNCSLLYLDQVDFSLVITNHWKIQLILEKDMD